ncbi:hypothetical protein Fuma_01151 [Fuerstiella marisgermanici]|uniref:Uncharacterized protein n=2 Tax=Fuerstiella marisgermanici TaxID=1891926 RepID=A0A1P8WBX9_9PLAN|nr:hypothetical protein Fuma_01151 [Fuerstiella marisgermanici]
MARAEIAEITQQDQLRKAIQQVESGRIFVNTKGIQSALSDESLQNFVRLQRVLKINNQAARKQLEVTGIELAGKSVVYVDDYSSELLREFAEEIRDEFVGNTSHGLNTYISVHIRHGYISSQVRGQFELHHLATRETNGAYQDNQYWLERLEPLGNVSLEKANRLFKAFSSDLDEIVEEVNSKWIRIKDPEYPT